MKVSTAEFMKHYGALADRALNEAVTITKNGRDRLVVISAEEYARLKRRDRQVVRLEDFTAADISAITVAAAPSGFGHLDEELKDWRP